MMNYPRLLFLACVLFVEAGQLAVGQISCLDNGNYTRNSRYAVNLNRTFTILSRELSNDGFYNASIGDGNDRAYAMVLCKGDAQLDACRSCIQESVDDLLRSCPSQKQAIRWEERCILRYSNATFYGYSEVSPMWFISNVNNATNPGQFKEDLIGLLGRVRGRAASGSSLRKVGWGNVTRPGSFETIFALLQCTPDLYQEGCNRCLYNAISNVPVACDAKVGCRINSPSCTLQYEIYTFYNETRLQELEAVSLSPPPPAPAPDSPSSSSGKGNGNTTRTVIIIIVIPIVLSLVFAISAIIWLRKRKTQKPAVNHYEKVDEISTAESLQYAFSTVKTATDDFSDDNKLGEGGFGSVYKGELPNGQEIAVKRLSINSGQGDLEFKNEVLLLAKLQHRNLVRLFGFAIEGTEKLLIYELVKNASLDQFIFDERRRSYLDWDRRYKIIGGIARGIIYLHEDSRLRIIHRDLKASNILLDGEMNPKIADFGMARLFGQDETQGNTSRIVGTHGYMPPEYVMHGQFSIKSDVFSFGVLVLEIITGKSNNVPNGENVEDLLTFAWKNWREGRAANVVDPTLRSGSGSMSEMVRCIHIGLLCVQENAVERPTMASVVIMLSSSSISLAVPCEPAFYSTTWQISTTDPEISVPAAAQQLDSSSDNDVSITELYPR